METKDILFFNKDGNLHNFSFNESRNIWEGKILFDKNSNETYKTQGMYVFEKLPAMSDTDTFQMKRFQLFNNNTYTGIYFIKGGVTAPITLIEPVNTLSTNKAKWIYGTDFHTKFPIGSQVKFKGLTGEFVETTSSRVNLFQVIQVKKDAVMVITSLFNNAFVAPSSYTTAELVSLNIIQKENANSSGNDYQVNSHLYAGKKITVSHTESNDGIYTVKELANTISKHRSIAHTMFWTLPIPTNSTFRMDITFKNDRVLLYDGEMVFSTGKITFTNGVPNLITVGSVVVASSGSNLQNFTVTSINKESKFITVTSSPSITPQTITTRLYFSTNVITLTQKNVIINGVVDIRATYHLFIEKYKDILFNMYGIEIRFFNNLTALYMVAPYGSTYFTIATYCINDTTGASTVINANAGTDTFNSIIVEEELENEYVNYQKNRQQGSIYFDSIDSGTFTIIINGQYLSVESAGDVDTTLRLWEDTYVYNSEALNNLGIYFFSITDEDDKYYGYGFGANDTNAPRFNIDVSKNADVSIDAYAYYFPNINAANFSFLINGAEYTVPYNTDVITTCADWIAAHGETIKRNHNVTAISANRAIDSVTYYGIYFGKTIFNYYPTITYNNSKTNRFQGDVYFVYEINSLDEDYIVISGNEIVSTTVDFLAKGYSTGQTIRVYNSTTPLLNKAEYYNIIGVTSTKMSLSYQGVFKNETVSMTLSTGEFLRFPRKGIVGDNKSKLVFSWEETLKDDIFFYDFSGTQLKEQDNNLLTYVGDKPLIGANGTNLVRLNKLPNTDPLLNAAPEAQQTIFDKLEFEMEYINSTTDLTIEPEPMQVFFALKSETEGVVNSTMYVYVEDDKSFTIPTETVEESTPNDKVEFDAVNGTIKLVSPSTGINFITFGLQTNQYISFSGTDSSNRAVFQNNGRIFKITNIEPYTLTVTAPLLPMVTENNVKDVPVQALPYVDENGDAILEEVAIPLTLKIESQPVAEIQVYGQTEIEDERFAVHLHNFKGDALQMKDFFIFREYDVNEYGVDWVYINRKRKELIQVYDDIFDNVNTYYSVINAIKFFGYSDLSFNEYYRNINMESPRFGQLFNAELIGLFDPNVVGWTSGNSVENKLPNANYVKTNLFGLSYKITDEYGNYVWGISKEEAQIKLFGLKNWLQRHVMELGTKLLDIQGKFYARKALAVKHESYITKKYVTADSLAPITVAASGYLHPVSPLSQNYNIKLVFGSRVVPEYFNLRITTFGMDNWVSTKSYKVDDIVYYAAKVYKCLQIHSNIEPASQFDINHWAETTDWTLVPVQQIEEQRFNLDDYVITVNKTLDPHIRVEIIMYNGYGCSWNTTKTYSLEYGAWS